MKVMQQELITLNSDAHHTEFAHKESMIFEESPVSACRQAVLDQVMRLAHMRNQTCAARLAPEFKMVSFSCIDVAKLAEAHMLNLTLTYQKVPRSFEATYNQRNYAALIKIQEQLKNSRQYAESIDDDQNIAVIQASQDLIQWHLDHDSSLYTSTLTQYGNGLSTQASVSFVSKDQFYHQIELQVGRVV